MIAAVSRLAVKSIKLQVQVGTATGLVVLGDLVGEGSAQEQLVVGEARTLLCQTIDKPGSYKLVNNLTLIFTFTPTSGAGDLAVPVSVHWTAGLRASQLA